jgi:predicted nucleic acid-binding protein
MLVALDSNILLRFANRKDPQNPEARSAVRLLLGAKADLCFFPQNAAEYWSVSTRPATARGGYGWTIEYTSKRLRAVERLFTVLLDDPTQFSVWRQLVEVERVIGHNVHDARLVAAMTVHGVTHLLTYDIRDFRRYTGISVFTPAEVIARGGKI